MGDEALLNAVFEASSYAQILVDEQGNIVLVNAQAEKLFGYTRDELLGQSIEILVPERFRPSHPGLRTAFTAAPLVRALGTGRDLYGRRKDGGELQVEIGLNPVVTEAKPFTLVTITV